MIDSAAVMVIGQELKVEMETLGRYLAPRRFIERRQVSGSPASEKTREWLAVERARLAQDRAWAADCPMSRAAGRGAGRRREPRCGPQVRAATRCR